MTVIHEQKMMNLFSLAKVNSMCSKIRWKLGRAHHTHKLAVH